MGRASRWGTGRIPFAGSQHAVGDNRAARRTGEVACSAFSGHPAPGRDGMVDGGGPDGEEREASPEGVLGSTWSGDPQAAVTPSGGEATPWQVKTSDHSMSLEIEGTVIASAWEAGNVRWGSSNRRSGDAPP